MPQLRVYRSFIKRAADSGKYLIIWDEKRRYEGQFKGFDPQGEFVILANVKIKDESEEIESPEILIPIENIKVVSTETEEEYAKRRAAKSKIKEGYIMPGVTEETVKKITGAWENLIKVKEEETEGANEPAPLKQEEKIDRATAAPEKQVPSAEKTDSNAGTETAAGLQTKQAQANDLVSVLEEDVDTASLSSSTKELVEKLKAVEKEPGEPATPVKKESESVKLEETAPAIEAIPKIEVEEPKKSEDLIIPEPKVEVKEAGQVEQVRQAKTVPEQDKQKRIPQPQPSRAEAAKPATAVIEEKSRKAASSTLFKEQKVGKPEIPKRRVDIGTLILDVIIVVLSIVAIGILAVTLFNIRLPFF